MDDLTTCHDDIHLPAHPGRWLLFGWAPARGSAA
jgi:hypothetical protein